MQDTHALEWCWISYFHSSIPLLLLQIQQVTFFLLRPSRKIVSGVLSFLSLSHLLVSYISTRHMKIHLKLMTSRIYRKKNISYANLSCAGSLERISKSLFYLTRTRANDEKVTWKRQTDIFLLLLVPSDFKWSFLYFVQCFFAFQLQYIYFLRDERSGNIFILFLLSSEWW